MRRRWPRVLAGLLVVLVLLAVGGYWYERPLLRTGTGYAAHNACALTFIAKRSNPETDLPPNPLVPYLSTTVDESDSTARTSIKGLLAKQTATYDPATGCTVGDRDIATDTTQVPAMGTNPLATQSVTTDAEVDRLIAAAFGDELNPAERERLGTRAVVVVQDGQIVGERYADGFTQDTPQLGWSMTKSVTNLLTGRLVQAGAVSLTDDHLRPEWTDGRSAITVDQLLRMTSGLEWDETYSLGTPITQMLYGERDMAGYVASQKSAHAPGSYQQYSSGSTTLLCAVLGSRVKASTNLVPAQVLAPLGLSSAVLETDGVGNPVCSSYLWATPREWAALGQFALQDGVWGGQRLLPEGWMKDSTTTKAVAQTEEKGYASGWWSNTDADGSLVEPTLTPDTYSMQGHDGQRVYVVPSKRLVVVRLGFSPDMAGEDPAISPLVAALSD
ncbi:serine hydrolase domain-containing protein [Knoellia subterranea]|uniref:Beta-lactamase n=1 Tax=Knoellia subterranea KCTC 19937 TaxID=1385521 RepID=A0A0A0JIE9_9MICO|nr:serine hydrolase [Knoellia subterranea]KGN37175.1 beta-lactamase [Knoellia subterranea KCTC 19937]